MRYCSFCGSSNLQKIIPEGDHFERIVCTNCGNVFYNNPKIVVGCLPIYKGKIMLAKRGINPQKGKWNLPAGFLELDETIENGARRECYEETAAEIASMKIYSIFHSPSNHMYVFFLAELESDEYETNFESPEIKFFPPEKIPWKDLAFDSNEYVLKSYINGPEHLEKVDIKSDF